MDDCGGLHINRNDNGEVMQMNIDKLLARYPDGFSEERSLHRAEDDI